ncbi:MAG: POT family MFS transporter [Bdellovibrionales bacterium]|nr:POT family MFS transporter [Bdellovibrionales bacterium]
MSQSSSVKTQAQISDEVNKDRFPYQIRYIVAQEGCERYSFYGMRNILTIFMVHYLLFTDTQATSIYHLFVAATYLTPLLGGYISDRFWGKYKTILRLSILYCVGHAVLAIWENQMGLYWGLGLIALGAGGIKPCVSAHVGDQFTQSNKHLIKKVFDLFYWLINFGSFLATMITPLVLKHYGPGWAFGIPGILMAIATFIFWRGKKHYVHIPPTGKNPDSFMKVFFSALTSKVKEGSFFDRALSKHPKEAIEGAKSAVAIGVLLIPITMFWAMFDQHGSTWVLQAKEMNLNFMGIEFLPSQIAALNPIMVMTMIPLFGFVLYPWIEKKLGITITPLRKMCTGMVIAGLSFVAVAIYQYMLDAGVQLNVGWHFIPYLIITASEILVSITGLEFAYTQAPRSMRSTIMSIFFLTIFLGNVLTASIAKFNVFEGGNFFMFFAILTLLVSGIFIWMANRYEYRDYVERD